MDSIGQYWTLARRAILVGYKGRGLYPVGHNPNSPRARSTTLAKKRKMTIEERLGRLEKRNKRLTTALTLMAMVAITIQFAACGNDCNVSNVGALADRDLSECDLVNADLVDADLEGANLRNANLDYANLRGANLKGADLGGADLRYAKLKGADLRHANLRDANLEGANLRDANLRYANLKDANLGNANLEGANLYKTYLEGAINTPLN